MRRAGFSDSERLELKQIYRILFRQNANLRSALASARKQFASRPAQVMFDFLASSQRGFCCDSSSIAFKQAQASDSIHDEA